METIFIDTIKSIREFEKDLYKMYPLLKKLDIRLGLIIPYTKEYRKHSDIINIVLPVNSIHLSSLKSKDGIVLIKKIDNITKKSNYEVHYSFDLKKDYIYNKKIIRGYPL